MGATRTQSLVAMLEMSQPVLRTDVLWAPTESSSRVSRTGPFVSTPRPSLLWWGPVLRPAPCPRYLHAQQS